MVLNVFTGANVTQLTVTALANVSSANIVSGVYGSATVGTAIIGSANVSQNINAQTLSATTGHYGPIVGSNAASISTLTLGTALSIANGGTGQTAALSAFNALSPMSAAGDILYGGVSGSGTRLAAGTSVQILHSGATPSWGSVVLTTDVSGTLPIANGGTNATTKASAFDSLSPMSAAGDIIYGGTSGTNTRLAAGTSVQILHSGATPSWGSVVLTTDVSGTLPVANGGTGVTSSTGSGSVVLSASPTLSGTITGGTFSGTHSGSGASLTNLPLNQFSGLTAGGVAYGSATTTLATNSAGTSGQPLLSGGTSAPTWGTLGLAYGGTGQTSAQSAINTLAGAVTSAQYLRGNGTNVVMSAIQASDVPTLNQSTTGTSGGLTGTPNITVGTISCSSVTGTSTIQTSYSQTGAPNVGMFYGYNPTNSAGQNASCSVRTAGGSAGYAYYSMDVNGVGGWSMGLISAGTASSFYMRASWDFSTTTIYTFDRSGNFTAAADVIAYSDRRYKTDLERITGALDKVSKINGYTFVRTDLEDKRRKAGVIAQEIQEVLPEVVQTTEDGTLSVAYGNIVALLIEAIKEERAKRESLEERILALEKKV